MCVVPPVVGPVAAIFLRKPPDLLRPGGSSDGASHDRRPTALCGRMTLSWFSVLRVRHTRVSLSISNRSGMPRWAQSALARAGEVIEQAVQFAASAHVWIWHGRGIQNVLTNVC